MTENHGFQTPEKGSNDWQKPLNTNFEKLDTSVEVRDTESNRDSYAPTAGAKFFATDTGNIFIGDGSTWLPTAVPDHGHDELSVGSVFGLPVTSSDPDSAGNGELWYRQDSGELRVATESGIQTLAYGSSTDDTDSTSGEVGYDVTEPFDDSSWKDTFGEVWDYGVDSNADITDIDGRSGNQLELTVPGGENRGVYTVHNHETRTGSAPTELYHKFYLRFKPGFTDNITDDGKLPGFAGRGGTDEGAGGNPADGTGWSARMGWDDPGELGSEDKIALDYYVYHMDASGSYGDHEYWGQMLEEGVWYLIEQYIDLGKPNKNDGTLRGWIDGELAYDRNDFRFRRSSGNDVQWTWLDLYHGGGEAPNGDIGVQLDDLKIMRNGMP